LISAVCSIGIKQNTFRFFYFSVGIALQANPDNLTKSSGLPDTQMLTGSIKFVVENPSPKFLGILIGILNGYR